MVWAELDPAWERTGANGPHHADIAGRAGAPPPALRARILNNAIYGLARRTPHWSAARRITPGQQRVLLGLAALAAVCAALSPSLLSLLLSVSATAGFGALIAFRFAAALAARPIPAFAPAPDATLPRYTVMAALYREARVVPRLIAELRALDYPPALLEIMLVIEEDDAETLAAARARADGAIRILTVPKAQPRTKPKALSYALAFATGELLTIYDAEDRPDPAQLRAAAAAFAAGGDRLACVQAPLTYYNAPENFFTRCFQLEYAIHFRVMLPALVRLGAPIPLGGTSNHFRTDVLRAAGGWDPFNVTEDADLGFRLAAGGWRVGMIAPPTREEATCALWPWMRQRSRWLKGYTQTILVHTRRAAHGFDPRKALALWLTLGGALAAAALHGPALLWLGWTAGRAALLGGSAPVLPLCVLGLGYASTVGAGLAAARLTRDRALLLAILLTPFYWPLQTWAAAMALWQLVRAPFRWEKTDHGVSRMTPAQ